MDLGLWRVTLGPLQGLWRGTQGVEEFPEPLGDHVLVGIGNVAPVLGLLSQGGEEGLGGGLAEHLHGSGRHGVGCLDEGRPHAGPRQKMDPWGSASWSLVYLENCLSITGAVGDPASKE